MIGTPGGSADRPATFFTGPEQFRAWLDANHATASELWMGLRKKHVDDRGLTWEQAVPEALCFGWIDSVAQRIDADSTRQRWTPRRPGSVWSNVNIALVESLTAQGRMRPEGLAAFTRRRADRSGVYSHESGEQQLPPDYAARLDADPGAAAFWPLATPSYRRVAIHWVLSAKRADTREKRMAQLLADCAAGRPIPIQRQDVRPKWMDAAAAAARDAAAAAARDAAAAAARDAAAAAARDAMGNA